MKFEFDSIGELQDFLEFAGYERDADRRARDAARLHEAVEALVPDADLTPEQRAAAQARDAIETRSYPNGTTATGIAPLPETSPVQGASPPAQVNAAGRPRRARRTKAEMDAERAALAGTNLPAEAPTDAQATAATSPLAGANPFDASTSNEPAATAALNEAPAGTTGTLAALGSEAVSAAQDAVAGLGADVDPQAFIQLRVAEMGGTFDPREHMKKCVEFIGALGKAKYDEAFTLAGTSRSVASYAPADCAKHIAALEYLQIAG